MSLESQIEKFRQDYYNENGGKKSSINFFSKSKQKTELAQHITHQFNLEQLLEKTVYNIPNTNIIVIDYTIFKLYASEDTYLRIINHIINIFDYCISKYGIYSVHINLDTFSTTAAQRHRHIIEMFNARFDTTEENIYVKYVSELCIYYPPSVLEMIYNMLKNLLNPKLKQISRIIPKTESAVKFAELHKTVV